MPVGKTLAAERRSQGKTLVDIRGSTRIMGRLLQALEEERWDDLPSPVYVKGYIQNYAHALSIDPAPLLAEYAADQQSHAAKPKLERIPGRTVVPHQREVHEVPRQVWAALAIAVLLIALAVWGVSALLGRDDTPPPIPPVGTPTATPKATLTAPGVTGAEAEPTTVTPSGESLEGGFELVVAVAAGQSSWLKIDVDGLTAYEGTLPGGQEKRYTVTGEAFVRIGKPASVTVTRDGEPVAVPLGQGIAEVRVTADEE